MTHPLSEAGTSVEVSAKFLDQMAMYWHRKAVVSYEDADAQASAQNAQNCAKAAELLRALIQPTPAETDAKPVAWQGVAPDGGVFLTGVKRMAEMWEAGDWIVRALYPASPTPPPIGDGEAKPAGYVIATFLVERRGEFERNGTTLYHAPMGMAQTPLYPATAIESLSRQLEEAEAVLSFADEGYANQDVSHEDYRVRVAQAANEYFQDNPDRAKETVSHG